jgi:hypothetical protein
VQGKEGDGKKFANVYRSHVRNSEYLLHRKRLVDCKTCRRVCVRVLLPVRSIAQELMRVKRVKPISTALFTAVAFLSMSGAAMSGPVGAYICAIDNCGAKYSDLGQAEADACRAGVQGADKRPSNPSCLKMCDADFGPKGKSQVEACKTGCAMFPSECLRDGAVPPADSQLTRPRTERYAPPPPKPSPQPRYRDYPRW